MSPTVGSEDAASRAGNGIAACECVTVGDGEIAGLIHRAATNAADVPESLRARLEQTIPVASGNGPRELPKSQGSRSRRITLAMALAAAVALAVFWPKQFEPVRPANAATYARVVDGLRRAPSLHLRFHIAKQLGGPLELDSETWYSSASGQFERRFDSQSTLVSTPEAELSLFSAERIAVWRNPMAAPAVLLGDMLDKYLMPYSGDLRRAAEGDMSIDDVPCEMFVGIGNGAASRPHLTEKEAGQVRVWMNGNEPRRIEMWWHCDGGWRISYRMDVDMQAAVDPAMFAATMPSDYRQIDSRTLVDRAYPLSDADVIVELRGFVAALHQTRRLPDGLIAATATLRPSDVTRARLTELSRKQRVSAHIPMQMFVGGVIEPGNPGLVAELMDRSFQVVWFVLPESSLRRGSPDEFAIGFMLADMSDERVLSRTDGLPAGESGAFRIRPQSLAEYKPAKWAQTTYDEIAELSQIRPNWLCTLYGDPFSNVHQRLHLQSRAGSLELRVTSEAFVNAFRAAWEK